MKTLKLTVVIVTIAATLGLTIVSCTSKKYKYKIIGQVRVPKSDTTVLHDAIWYTDTISFDEDTAYYFNSDGSEVRIYPPFILLDNTKK
jgi:hypothetical protein